MSDFTNINYSEKIVAFIDGELHPSETESLFLNLAASPQLQEEMRQQLLISRSLKSSLIAPPDILKKKIFASIGADITQSSGQKQTIFSKLLDKRVVIVLSSLLVFFLLSTIYLFKEYQSLKNFDKKQSATSFVSPDNSNNIPVIQSIEIENHKEKSNSFLKKNTTQNLLSRKKSDQNFDSGKLNQIDNAQFPTYETHPSSSDELPYLYVIDKSYYEQLNSELNFNKSFKLSQLLGNIFSRTDFLDKLSMQIRFFEAKNFTNSNVKSTNRPILNNFGLTLLYDLDKNNAFAIEVGQEDFQQRFEGNINDFPALFKQNYTAFWVGTSYQYTHTNYGIVDPYVRAMIGGTRIGPLVKLNIGGKYYLSNKLYVFAGIENTALFYKFQNKQNTSLKSGISAGLSVKF